MDKWTIYEVLSPVLMAILGWVSVQVASYIKAKTKNQMAAGMLMRLNDSIFTAVRAANEVTKKELLKARGKDSPGGSEITPEEAKELKKAALDSVTSYWGKKGLREAASVIGLNGDLNEYISDKIESAVVAQKKDPT